MPPVCASSPADKGAQECVEQLLHAPLQNLAQHPALLCHTASTPAAPLPTWRALLHQLPRRQHQQLVAVHDGV